MMNWRRWTLVWLAITAVWPLSAAADNATRPATGPSTHPTTESADLPITGAEHYLVLLRPTESLTPPPTSLLEREIFRQALLMSGREELGLWTRDQVLRETEPGDAGDMSLQEVRLNTAMAPNGRQFGVEIDSTTSEKLEVAIDRRLSPMRSPSIVTMVRDAEGMSRGTFLLWLNQAGFIGKPLLDDENPPVPEGIEDELAEMNLIAQYDVVRQAHEAMREHGRSRRLMDILVRGYANLGQLTYSHWTAEADVYAARSLLYAQKMVMQKADDPLGWWDRAYALAMAGRPADALADVEKAKTLDGTQSPPIWGTLIDPLCRYQTSTLIDLSKKEKSLHGVGMLMAFLTVTNSLATIPIDSTGNAALLADPWAGRISHRMLVRLGIGVGVGTDDPTSGLWVQPLRYYLPKIKPLPESVAAAWAAAHTNPDLMRDVGDVTAAFVEADEPAEPSWSALGRSMQEEYFASACFANLGASDEQYSTEVPKLLGNHPYQAVVNGFFAYHGGNGSPDSGPQLEMVDQTFRMSTRRWPPTMLGFAKNKSQEFWWMQVAHLDPTSWDLESALVLPGLVKLGAGRCPRIAAQAEEISPYSPYAAAGMLKWNVPIRDELMARWKQDLADQPTFDRELGRKLANDGKSDQAIPWLQKAIKAGQDNQSAVLLADCYLKTGDEDNWLATLQGAIAALPADQYGQFKGNVRVRIANHYLAAGRYNDALKYAEMAIETSYGIQPAIRCAIQCCLMTGDYAAAEQYAQRTPNTPLDWYFVCRTTGTGDLDGARHAMHMKIANEDDEEAAATFYFADGDMDNAQKWFKKWIDSGAPEGGYWLAAIAGAKGDAVKQSAMLDQVREMSNRRNPDYGKLAALMQYSMKTKQPLDIKAVQSLETIDAAGPASVPYFAAEFLMQNGDKDGGLKLLKDSAARGTLDSRAGRQARVELHDMGIDPYKTAKPATEPDVDEDAAS